jgi:hypothetical protein
MNDPDRHAHWQIQYDNGAVETLAGFDPSSEKDRKFLHENLDEYLDYLVTKMKSTQGSVGLNEDPMSMTTDRFIIFGHIDSH